MRGTRRPPAASRRSPRERTHTVGRSPADSPVVANARERLPPQTFLNSRAALPFRRSLSLSDSNSLEFRYTSTTSSSRTFPADFGRKPEGNLARVTHEGEAVAGDDAGTRASWRVLAAVSLAPIPVTGFSPSLDTDAPVVGRLGRLDAEGALVADVLEPLHHALGALGRWGPAPRRGRRGRGRTRSRGLRPSLRPGRRWRGVPRPSGRRQYC